MNEHVTPSAESLISEDVNTTTDDVVITWVSTQPLVGGSFHPIITTDQRVECRCQDCGHRCMTPVEVRSTGELHRGHFEETPDGAFLACPRAGVVCGSCSGDTQTEAPLALPRRDPTPEDWYDELSRVQRAIVESIGKLRDYSPRPPYLVTENTDEWVDRTAVTRVVGESYYDDSTANTVSASVSRAIQPLIDDPPVLVGAYRGWIEYYGDKTPARLTQKHERLYSQGPDADRWGFENTAEDRKPTLQKVKLRHSRGLEAATVYFAFRDRLEEGERLTRIRP